MLSVNVCRLHQSMPPPHLAFLPLAIGYWLSAIGYRLSAIGFLKRLAGGGEAQVPEEANWVVAWSALSWECRE
jgi:hypothetical protein